MEFRVLLPALRALRNHVSQERLSIDSGLNRVEVNKVENGINKARTSRIQHALAQGLGVSADVIRGLVNETLSEEDTASAFGVSTEELRQKVAEVAERAAKPKKVPVARPEASS